MPKENDVTDQRELTAQELEVVTGGFYPLMIGAVVAGAAGWGRATEETCPDWACGTQH